MSSEPPFSRRSAVEGPDAPLGAAPTVAPGEWSEGRPTSLPAQFGRYQLLRLLGKGGMGVVYLAHDPQLDRLVAVKIPLFRENGDDPSARFFREARAAATLNHPHLCPVYDVGENGGVLYLTMAYIDGQPLSALIQPGSPLPPGQAVEIARLIALALQEAHDHGVIHRDLKPANVMINRKGQPVIMDFGLARRPLAPGEARITQSGVVLGTPAYMAPEQIDGDHHAVGPCSDVYALGVILYEMLTSRLPFDGPFGSLMARILLDPPDPPSHFCPGLNPRLEAACLKALAKKPADRHASMSAFAAALADALAAPAARSAAALPAARRRRWTPTERARSRPGSGAGLLIGCGVLLLLLALLGGGLSQMVGMVKSWFGQ